MWREAAMTKRRVVILAAAFVIAAGVSAAAGALSEVLQDRGRLRETEAVLKEMSESFDTGIPQSLFAKAECVVIIPSVRRAALGFGGQYGRGYMACRRNDRKDWSAPAAVRIEGGSVGLQIGGSATDVIMLVMNERGADRLLSSRFTVGADASEAAGPVGRQATAQTDATMMAEILAWSRARGIFAGISLHGSTLRADSSENENLYGREISNREIVTGDLGVPEAAKSLMEALKKY
jgi:lipid-binding SYLF domain-containing protein